MVNFKKKIEHFIANSPKFFDDNVLSIDKKHKSHIQKAYENLLELNIDNFRNWGCQSDILLNKQIKVEKGLLNGIVKPIVNILFYKLIHKEFIQNLQDDILIIEKIGGKELLLENPVNKTPGEISSLEIGNYSVNYRWLRYLYISKKINDLLLDNKKNIWIDIGSYYGGLQGIVKKYNPNTTMILIDFHHQLLRSYLYLSTIYPDSKHILPNEITGLQEFEQFQEGDFIYLPTIQYDQLKLNFDVNLLTNFFSFGEMKRETYKIYERSRIFKKAKIKYFINRFVSNPFFEKLYDSDLNIFDYVNERNDISHFDVFPIHHFQRTEVNLFGNSRKRNISSPYFELILNNT